MTNTPLLHLFRKDYWLVFLGLWLITGISINSSDQRAFTLQQMGVDAIVSHGTFTLGHSDLQILTPRGDTFHAEKGILPAKQPGQFATAAIPYFFLKAVGVSYENDYTWSASLVTWLSTSLVSAIALTLLFLLIKLWGYTGKQAAWVVFAAGIFSPWLVYAGISHHDIVAASYLLIGLFFAELNLITKRGNGKVFPLLAGLFAGLTVFASMLPALIVMVFGLYILSSLNKKHILFSGLGFILGLLPLALYNSYYFGSPFTQANVAGNYADTFFNYNYEQFIHHLNAYVGWGGLSILKYAPIIAIGFFGTFFLPKELLRIKIFIFGSCIMHMAYLTNIETLGTCQYGPRYLIPIIPLCAIGLAPLFQKFEKQYSLEWGMIFGGLAFLSFLASAVGAWGGAMQCNLNDFMMLHYLVDHSKLQVDNLPLLWPILYFFTSIMAIIFIGKLSKNKRYLALQKKIKNVFMSTKEEKE